MSVAVGNPASTLSQVNVKMKDVTINDVRDSNNEKTEEDLYKELKNLHKKLEFLDIKTDYVKEEMKLTIPNGLDSMPWKVIMNW